MKLATLRDGSRDGRLVVVSRDLSRCLSVMPIATLQQALDEWDAISATLQLLSDRVNASAQGAIPFDPKSCLAPLPRAYQWADASAYVNHVALVRKARGAEMPESFWTDPLMYQGGSDSFLAPCDPIVGDESWGIDFEAEIAIVTGVVPIGASTDAARRAIRLIMLANDVSLRNLIPGELAKGFGFFQSKPSSAFSPVAVTPDELADAWDGERLHLPLVSQLNETPFGQPNAGVDMTFTFPTLVAHAAKTRRLAAGTIIGSGTVSNRGPDGGPGRPVSEGGLGYSCIAEQRMVETIRSGSPKTPFLKSGDRVQIEMHGADGQSIFGAIDQTVEASSR